LGRRATIKALHDYLKLHLLASFTFATLLTRGYFEILFEDEEGAKAIRKLTAVEWNGLSLSFSRFVPNFDANSQGVEALLTHTIKTLLEILSFATSHYAAGMQLIVVCNYRGHICNYKFGIV